MQFKTKTDTPIESRRSRSKSGSFKRKASKSRKSNPSGQDRSISPSKPTPRNRKHVGGYMDAIADQEANMISMMSLQEGEEFEKDINNIIGIIDNVEKNMNHNRLIT